VSGHPRTRRHGLSLTAAAATVSFVVVATLCSCTRAEGEGNRPAIGADSTSATVAANSRPPTSVAPPADPLADSADALDRRFQELRSAINRDARALAGSALDRRSAAYATRFDELRRRTLAAESLRVTRDQLRRRRMARGAGRAP